LTYFITEGSGITGIHLCGIRNSEVTFKSIGNKGAGRVLVKRGEDRATWKDEIKSKGCSELTTWSVSKSDILTS
jgi:hypothetical protein